MKNKKNRKIFLIFIILLAVIALFSIFHFFNKDKPGHRNANIILIVSDALRYDVLGCYGGDADTPNIDWIAKNGLLFENAYSTAPCTMPSAVSIATGNYSRTYSLVINEKTGNPNRKYICYVHKKEKLLSKELKLKGYDVKMNIENSLAASANNFQGFEEFRQIKELSEAEIRFVENRIRIRKTGRPKKNIPSFSYYHMYDLLHYLLTVPQSRHFFVVKWFFDPHAPYDPPRKFKKRIPIAPDTLPQEEGFYSKSFIKDFNRLVRVDKFSKKECAYIKALYKAEVESLDERVGYILEAMKQRNLLKKTIIVFTSDHGEAFLEHSHLGHGQRCYETLVHIPLIFMGPGIQAGKREKTVVSHLDLMPTLKELVGVKYADQTQGESYSALFYGRPISRRAPFFDRVSNSIKSKYTERDALLMDGYKLIVYKKGGKYVFKLFNLTDDSGEMKDISEENREIVRKMFKRITDLRKENKKRLEKNIAKIDKSVELDNEWEKTMEELKALGYI
jgi:arylsulfatase A-like enzyme